MNIREMSLEQKIGQLFVGGFPGKVPSDEFVNMVKRRKLGNVILFSHNVQGREQLTRLNHTLVKLIEEETGITPFISMDEEGGVVTRLPSDSAVMPSAMAQGNLKDWDRIYQGAVITVKELKAVGVNFNLAPVLDINSNHRNPVIGVRSYGETPEQVLRAVQSVVSAYQDEEFLCSGKHFPGHGDVNTDSHLGLPVLDVTRERLEKRELIPFVGMIRQGIPCLTIGHILVPGLDGGHIPCTMSPKVVTEFLRNKLDFRGLIISDCMEMNAIKEYYGVEKGVVGALAAGIDLIFISHTAHYIETSIQEIYRALEDGRLTEGQIHLAVQHILEAKERFIVKKTVKMEENRTDERIVKRIGGNAEDQRASQMWFANQFLRDTIRISNQGKTFELGENPLFVGISNTRTTQASDAYICDFAQVLQKRYGGHAITLPINPSSEEREDVRKQMQGKSSLMVGTLNGHLSGGQVQLLETIREFTGPAAHVALRNPYDLNLSNSDFCKIALYEYTMRSLGVLIQLMDERLL